MEILDALIAAQDPGVSCKHLLASKEFQEILQSSLDLLVATFHKAATEGGWWKDPLTGTDPRDNPLCFSNKLALVHSEISEALEGDRKRKADDHLPHFEARVVELGDAVIRIGDLAGAYKLPLGKATVEKLIYNARRADHKHENRTKAGGKAY